MNIVIEIPDEIGDVLAGQAGGVSRGGLHLAHPAHGPIGDAAPRADQEEHRSH